MCVESSYFWVNTKPNDTVEFIGIALNPEGIITCVSEMDYCPCNPNDDAFDPLIENDGGVFYNISCGKSKEIQIPVDNGSPRTVSLTVGNPLPEGVEFPEFYDHEVYPSHQLNICVMCNWAESDESHGNVVDGEVYCSGCFEDFLPCEYMDCENMVHNEKDLLGGRLYCDACFELALAEQAEKKSIKQTLSGSSTKPKMSKAKQAERAR